MGSSEKTNSEQPTIASLIAVVSEKSETIAKLTTTIDELRVEISKLRGESQTAPSVPSGQQPPYKKPASRKRKKSPGRKCGHVGVTRKKPESWDREEVHTAKCCPHCDGKVKACQTSGEKPSYRERFIEDIVLEKPETVLNKIGQYYCGSCKKRVEPAVTDAMPGDHIGLKVVTLTAVQHYLHGITVSRIVELLKQQHGFTITGGALVKSWQRLAGLFQGEYEEIRKSVVDRASVRYCDETSWRIAGRTHWLWCFCTKLAVYYAIDQSRSSQVVKEILGEWLDGVVVRDFYAAYNICIPDETQYCLAHVLREFKTIRTKLGSEASDEYLSFERKLKRLLKEAIRFHGGDHDPPSREKARERYEVRLRNISDPTYSDPDAERLAKRMSNCHEGIFTFLTKPGVDPTNNWAENNIRPAVIMRKNSFGNQSNAGAATQAILMSVFRSYRLQQRDVLEDAMKLAKDTIVANHATKGS
jgi:hypothetical protein